MSTTLKESALAFIAGARTGLLAIVREDGFPTNRPIGAFAPVAPDSADIYFTTPAASPKARALRLNPRASFFFQSFTDAGTDYKGVSLVGEAVELAHDSAEFPAAVAAIAARSAFFRAKVEKGDLAETAIFRIRAKELRVSDFALKHGVTEVPLQ
jgi:general stress protein 26